MTIIHYYIIITAICNKDVIATRISRTAAKQRIAANDSKKHANFENTFREIFIYKCRSQNSKFSVTEIGKKARIQVETSEEHLFVRIN